MVEIWKPIEGTDGRYEVSNTGKIRSLNYNKTGQIKELKQKTDRYGYKTVIIHMDGKQKYPSIHRLVANAFIPNPQNKPQVNHISGDKTDNRVENLEWCTASENVKHAFGAGLKASSIAHAKDVILKYNASCKKPITAINLINGEVLYFDSIGAASAALGIRDISKPLRKETQTAKGYCLEYGHLSAEEAEEAKQAVISSLGQRYKTILSRSRKRVV